MPTKFEQKMPEAFTTQRLIAIIFIAIATLSVQQVMAHEEAPPRGKSAAAAPANAAAAAGTSTSTSNATGPGTGNAAPPALSAPEGATPRVSARGDHLEVTALRDHGTLTLYLDDYATNTPVTDAQVIVALGGASGPAAPQPDGSYRWADDTLEAAAAGTVVRITVAAGSDAEQIDAPLPAGADTAAHGEEGGAPQRARSAWIGIAAAAAAVLLLAIALWRRARRAASAPAGH